MNFYNYPTFACLGPKHTTNVESLQILYDLITPAKLDSRRWGNHPNSNCLGGLSSFILATCHQCNLLQKIISAKVTSKPTLLLTSSLLICWEICIAREIPNKVLKQCTHARMHAQTHTLELNTILGGYLTFN